MEVSECRDIYLRSSRGILRRSSRDELSFVVVEQVIVEAEMFLFCEDGVVGFEVVFLQELGVSVK